MVSDVDSDRVDSAVTALRAAGVETVGLQADVSNEADVAALVTRAVEEVGPLDVMYNLTSAKLVRTARGAADLAEGVVEVIG